MMRKEEVAEAEEKKAAAAKAAAEAAAAASKPMVIEHKGDLVIEDKYKKMLALCREQRDKLGELQKLREAHASEASDAAAAWEKDLAALREKIE